MGVVCMGVYMGAIKNELACPFTRPFIIFPQTTHAHAHAYAQAVYKSLHSEVKELRSFSRTNFDLAIRLVKAYRKAVGRSSHVAGAMWRYVSSLAVCFSVWAVGGQGAARRRRFMQNVISHRHTPNPNQPTNHPPQLRKLEFTDDRRLYSVTQELEQQYAEAFSFGFVGLAHKELYAQTGSDWHVFRVGLRFGGALVLLVWVLWNAIADESQGINFFRHPSINIYMAAGGFLLLGWTWALNLAVWERAGVDYRGACVRRHL